jgi:hypothetical protein
MRGVLTCLCVLIAAPTFAQVQTGSILVKALDDQGAVMPGVSVTISSPVLVTASQSGVTDAGGVYRSHRFRLRRTTPSSSSFRGFRRKCVKASSCRPVRPRRSTSE